MNRHISPAIFRLNLNNCNLDRGDQYVNPYPDGFEKVSMKAGKSGEWAIDRFTLRKIDVALGNLHAIRDGVPYRLVPPGRYTRLARNKVIVMSDTPGEAHENYRAFVKARGRVLVSGLGIGFLLDALLRKPSVDMITVIEKEPDVIALTAPRFRDNPRVVIIQGDAYEWKPRPRHKFDFAWHDIWPSHLNEESVDEAYRLMNHYQRFVKDQDFWSRENTGVRL